MIRKNLLKLLTSAAVVAVLFSQVGVVQAAKIDFGGEEEDHFWSLDFKICQNGFTINAAEQLNDDGGMGDLLPFSLRLGSSDVPLKPSILLPAPIAGGFGGEPNRSFASGTATFLFQAQQTVGTQIHITIERWDHGLFTYLETFDPDEPSDHSPGFDDLWPDNLQFLNPPQTPPILTVENCLVDVDIVAPTTTATVSPPANGNGWTNTDVTVQLNATDNIGGSGVKMIEYQATGALEDHQYKFGNSVSFPISAEGITTITYITWDNAGNSESHTLAVNIDKTNPNLNITSPLAQNYLHTQTVPATWTVSDTLSGIASSSGTLDGIPVTNGQTLDLFTLTLGTHTLVVNAADNAGNTVQASVTFNIVVTIDSLIAATQRTCSLGWISKVGSCQSLLAKLRAAKVSLGRGQTQAARGQLNAFLNELRAQKAKSVNQSAYDLLRVDATYLLSTIQSKK